MQRFCWAILAAMFLSCGITSSAHADMTVITHPNDTAVITITYTERCPDGLLACEQKVELPLVAGGHYVLTGTSANGKSYARPFRDLIEIERDLCEKDIFCQQISIWMFDDGKVEVVVDHNEVSPEGLVIHWAEIWPLDHVAAYSDGRDFYVARSTGPNIYGLYPAGSKPNS